MNDLWLLAVEVVSTKDLLEKKPRLYSLTELDEDSPAVPVLDVGKYRIIFYRENVTVLDTEKLVAYPFIHPLVDELVEFVM